MDKKQADLGLFLYNHRATYADFSHGKDLDSSILLTGKF